MDICFPHYPKVEHSYEIFHKPKWGKEAITINLDGKCLSVPRSKIQCLHDMFISFAIIKILNYLQFYAE